MESEPEAANASDAGQALTGDVNNMGSCRGFWVWGLGCIGFRVLGFSGVLRDCCLKGSRVSCLGGRVWVSGAALFWQVGLGNPKPQILNPKP